jgi:TolB-like protein
MKKILFFALMALMAFTVYAQKKESLAVFPFTGGTGTDGESIAGSLARRAEMRNVFNKVTPVTQNVIKTMNFEHQFQRDSGLTDADTIFELGKKLNAAFVIAGYITKLGDRNLVLVSIMDVESLQQIAGDYRTYKTIEEINALIPDIAKKLAAAVPRDTSKLPGLSVPPFNISKEVNRNDAQVLAQILSCDLANGDKYAVLPRTDSVEKVLEEHSRQRSGATDQERVKRLGVGRNAQFVLAGAVEKLGTLNKFATDILDINDGNIIDGSEEQYTNFSQGFELMPKLADKLNDISRRTSETFLADVAGINAASAGDYTITVNGDFTAGSITFATNARKTITLRGDGSLRTISNNADSDLFTIPYGITLVLSNNIRLNGNGKKEAVVKISAGGTLRMETGAAISGGSGSLGGVYVSGGAFTMSGGTISGNSGGGVYVSGGMFTMNGGTISGNTAKTGGGVTSSLGGTFTMNGGTISGNTAEIGGGGVLVSYHTATFTMSGGTISGNTAEIGGGVYASGGTFIKTGGTIDGTNSAEYGSVVSVMNSDYSSKNRNTAAGPNVKLDSRVAGSVGGWE